MTTTRTRGSKRHMALTFSILALLAVLAAFLVPACRRDSNGPAKPTPVIVAQWGQEKYLIYLPLYVAMEKGFFSDEGLDVSLRFSGNDDQVFAAVLQGSAQFGVGDPVFTAVANERNPGSGFVVASMVDGVAIWGVTNQADLPEIVAKEDLAGLRVGTFPSPSTNYTLMKAAIESGGEALKTTKIVPAPIGGQIALLEKGEADIAMVLEPAASRAIAEGYRLVFSSPQFHGPFAFTGLTVSGAFREQRPEVVQKMVNGIQRALRYCHEDVAGAVAVARTVVPSLDAQVVENAVRRMVAERTLPTTALISEQSWAASVNVRLIVGDLKESQEYSKSVDASFARKAIQRSP